MRIDRDLLLNGMKKFVIYIFIFSMLIMPVFSFAQTGWKGLVPCSNSTTAVDGNVTPAEPCDFNAFMTLIDTVIHFILFYMAVPIAAIMFFYAGFLMVTSGGSSESKTRAKSIFSNAVFGLVFAAGAWLIIMTILSILGYEGAWI